MCEVCVSGYDCHYEGHDGVNCSHCGHFDARYANYLSQNAKRFYRVSDQWNNRWFMRNGGLEVANKPNQEVWAETMAVLLVAKQPMTATEVGKALDMTPQAAYGRLLRLSRAGMVNRKVDNAAMNYRIQWFCSMKGKKKYQAGVTKVELAKPREHSLPDVHRRVRRTLGH